VYWLFAEEVEYMKVRLLVGMLIVIMSMVTACTSSSPSPAPNSTNNTNSRKTNLIVFEADSLIVPFAQIQKEFEAANPNINVEIEAHGSILGISVKSATCSG